ncbi:hypothetical protein HanRHA438_Chr02g0055761 [Helianthus annuus]|nr:hypothetical protein HanRHA438_Chr02g0055761 [Helianthus annuus]KAJ0950874.1 hypothetical protein HanPSC8_Chr02g0053371 [Helianthus annuus]
MSPLSPKHCVGVMLSSVCFRSAFQRILLKSQVRSRQKRKVSGFRSTLRRLVSNLLFSDVNLIEVTALSRR